MRRSLFVTLLGTITLAVSAVLIGAGLLWSRWSGLAVSVVALAIGSLSLGGLAALGSSWWLAGRIRRPLVDMAQAAEAAAAGRAEVGVPATSIAELHRVGQALHALRRVLAQGTADRSAERHQGRAILESMVEGVIALDAQGRVLLMNPSAGALFRTNPQQAVGRPLIEVVRQQDVNELLRQVTATRSAANREFMVFQPRERILKAHATPCVPRSTGAPVERGEAAAPEGPHTVMVIQDLTELHRYERLRREFVVNVTHELKSPLTAIRGLTETLRDGAIDDPSTNRRFVELIDAEAGRLAQLIDDLLQLAQIESSEAPVPVETVHLTDLVQELVPTVQQELSKRKLTLTISLDDVGRVRAVAERLRQVFVNLIDNAIKYNREGGRIMITAEPEGAWVRVSVSDTGIGIPAQDLPHVFERFYRVDKARSRALGGTGLGLSIVKHIVETHGGTVSVTSQPDQGSVFSFTLPRA